MKIHFTNIRFIFYFHTFVFKLKTRDMKGINHLKKLAPHLLAIVVFIVLSYSYFSPLLEGQEIKQSDITHYKGMSKEVRDYREKTGEEALWTNRLFGGMPAYFIGTQYKSNNTKFLKRLLNFGEKPVTFLFLYLIGFYIALLLQRVNPWLSIIGALAFGFSSYFFIIIAAGHNTKAFAIGYMPVVISAIIYAYRQKLWLGVVLTSLFLGFMIQSKHPQITYYTAIVVVFFGLFELYNYWKSKQLVKFLKVSGFLLIAMILAVGSNMGHLWTTYEYSDYSIRGESELEDNKNQKTSGLDKDYATKWSYGVDETLTLLIPNYKGGSSQGELSTDSETYKKLKQRNVPTGRAKQFIRHAPLYHGSQPFTSGPVYLGALVFFLFVFSLFIIKGPVKWWVLTVSVLAVMLSWGNNFPSLTDFFMHYFPAYNKFRSVSMILIIVEFTVPFLAFIGLRQFFKSPPDKQQFYKALKNTLYIVGGICLVFILAPGLLQDFTGNSDGQLPGWLSGAIREDRETLVRQDAFRSLIFILIGAALLWAYFNKKLKYSYTLILLGVFILIDMWPIDKRYLNDDNFTSPQEVKNPYKKSRADQMILQDQSKYYRVLNLAVNTFNDASTSYFHNSIGGYHGAKMQRYQEMIEYHIQDEMKNIIQTIQGKKINKAKLDRALKNQEVLNMLNTKYVIYNRQKAPLVNEYHLGNAWFVDSVRVVPDAEAEMNALNNFEPKKTAIVDKDFKDLLTFDKLKKDTSGIIQLTHYEPNHLKYDYQAENKQLVVFSDIYYPNGWELYIDDEEAELFRANYLLRAAVIPGGSHNIEMKFKPKSYFMGAKISNYSSLMLLILFVLVMGYEIYRYFKKQETEEKK